MFACKIDILDALKKAGYSTYRLRKDKIFGELTIQKFRKNGLPSWNELDIICRLTNLRFTDVVDRIDDE